MVVSDDKSEKIARDCDDPYSFHRVDSITRIIHRGVRKVSIIMRTYHELIKFAIVGFTTMLVDLSIFYTLTLTFMGHKPTIAKVIAGVSAMCLSYVLNRSWSFKTRGGNSKAEEAFLFFVISGIGVIIGACPVFLVNTFTTWRSTSHGLISRILVDFFVNYIVGNFLQMIFRFWALRKFAFPETLADVRFATDNHPKEERVPCIRENSDQQHGVIVTDDQTRYELQREPVRLFRSRKLKSPIT